MKNSDRQGSIGDGFSHQSHLWASLDLNTTKSSSNHDFSLQSNNPMHRSNNPMLFHDKHQPPQDPCSTMTNSNHRMMKVRVKVGQWVNESEGDWVRGGWEKMRVREVRGSGWVCWERIERKWEVMVRFCYKLYIYIYSFFAILFLF